ncbi:MAG: hypothetical protein QOC80_2671 [Frankiaceae bacterium]|nr:hypothetical protein [Frankiaceae bacterium]
MSTTLTGALGSGPLTLLVLGVVGLIGLLVAARLAFAPTAAAALLVVVVVSNISGVVGQVGPASIYLAALATATFALVLGVFRGEVVLRYSPFFLLFAVFIAVRALSVVFAATDVEAGIAELTDEAKGLVLLIVLTLLFASAERPHRLVALAVGVVAGFAALTAVQEFVLGNSTSLAGLSGIGVASEVTGLGARHAGTQGDPNFWCRVLVLFLPLALALKWSRPEGSGDDRGEGGTQGGNHRTEAGLRWRWVAAAGALLLGAYLSQSRGGMIAIFVAGVLTLMLLVRNRTRLLAGTAALVLVLSLLPGVGSRLATLGSLTGNSSTAVADPSLAGREAAQKAGLAMFRGSPLIGVGAANFEVAGDRYQRQLGISITEKKGLLAPHDIYVQQLAEGGLVGLVGYLVFYLGSIALMLATRRRWRALAALGYAEETEQRLSTAVVASLVGWGVASVFLHLSTLPILLVVIAVGASLHLRAQQAERATGLGDLLALPESRRLLPTGAARFGPSPTARTTAALLAVALTTGVGVALRSAADARPGYAATVRVGIVPVGTGGQAYAYSVLDRARTVPTLVTLTQSFGDEAAAEVGLSADARRDARLAVIRDNGSSSFRVRVVTRRADQAKPSATAVVDQLSRFLGAQQSLYGVQTLTTTAPTEVGKSRPVRLAVAALLAALGLAALLAAIRPARVPRADGSDDSDEFDEPSGPLIAHRR